MSKSVEILQGRAGSAPVRLALILGSGLGHLAQAVAGVAIPYADLPGFPQVSVSGRIAGGGAGRSCGFGGGRLRLVFGAVV